MAKRDAADEGSGSRKRRATTKKPSAAAYMGYSEDSESIGTSTLPPRYRFETRPFADSGR